MIVIREAAPAVTRDRAMIAMDGTPAHPPRAPRGKAITSHPDL